MTSLNAAHRLAVTADTADDIDNKQKQIDNLKRGLPSRQNRRSVNQTQRLNVRKSILNLESQIVDLRLREKAEKERR